MFECFILIIGGVGFIGFYLIDVLLVCGYCVCVLDNLFIGKCDNLFLDDEWVELFEGDVVDVVILVVVLKGCVVVVYLVVVVLVQVLVDDLVVIYQSNFIVILNFCEVMCEQGVKCVVFVFSVVVYGQNGEGMVIDEDILKLLLMFYVLDKLVSEYYFDFYCCQYGLELVIFCFFNVYGLCQDLFLFYFGVISIFIECVLKGMLIIVFGDGEQICDFIYVVDLVDFLVQVLEVMVVEFGVVNVGLNCSISLKQLLVEIGQVFGGLLLVIYVDV